MATAKVWTKVKVSMESARVAAVVITGISNATAAVVLTATPPTVGAFVQVFVPSVSQIDGRVFRVATVVAGTSFVLEGEDTTLYDIFSGVGTFQVVTLAVPITSATTINFSGGDNKYVSTTTIHAGIETQIPTLPNAAVATMENIKDFTDVGQAAMLAAARVSAQRVVKITWSNGNFMLFCAWVGFSGIPGGTAQNLVTTQAAFALTALPTEYAS